MAGFGCPIRTGGLVDRRAGGRISGGPWDAGAAQVFFIPNAVSRRERRLALDPVVEGFSGLCSGAEGCVASQRRRG